jgi:hypothetical protein
MSAKISRRGLTLIELLVIIFIIATLSAMLFPVIAQARNKSKLTTCLSGLRQVYIAYKLASLDLDKPIYEIYSEETYSYAGELVWRCALSDETWRGYFAPVEFHPEEAYTYDRPFLCDWHHARDLKPGGLWPVATLGGSVRVSRDICEELKINCGRMW